MCFVICKAGQWGHSCGCGELMSKCPGTREVPCAELGLWILPSSPLTALTTEFQALPAPSFRRRLPPSMTEGMSPPMVTTLNQAKQDGISSICISDEQNYRVQL